MIYRITVLFNNKCIPICDLELNKISATVEDIMIQQGLKSPILRNPKARFYFTTNGWKHVGKIIFHYLHQEGLKPRVHRMKNPTQSAVVYSDIHQVAVMR